MENEALQTYIEQIVRIKEGKRIYVPDGSLPWAKTHAMNPTVELLDNGVIRTYFSSLDHNGVGRIGYVDLDADNPARIIDIAKEPVLDIGLKGTFDDNGIVPSSIVEKDGTKYLYYFGFQKVEKVRFLMFTGLAISDDEGKTFHRVAHVPVLDRSNNDIYVRSLPHVIIEGDLWKVWYSGVNHWVDINGKELPFGEVRYAESKDGQHFSDDIKFCLSPYDDEFSLSRPFVFKEHGKYKMLISRRMKNPDVYKLGYAESDDGITWDRDDNKVSLEKSNQEWDSDMICYTSVLEVGHKKYLFYNGNGFGKTGFGFAEVETNE